jgi:dipeptidyl-peptidase 4
MTRSSVRTALGLLVLAAVFSPLAAQDAAAPDPAALAEPVDALRTAAEQSGFARHTSYAEMIDYLGALQARSSAMKLGSFGTTYVGRDLPYAIFSRPGVSRPEEALASGRPIVVLAANVHGGERTLRESVLIVARELATPGTELNRLLDHMIVLVVPSLNPDGLEATPRGTRGNALGIDMNRDYIKLEMPAIAHYVGNIINRWLPHLFVDGHNGGSFPYNLNYQCASNAAADLRLTELCDREIFPFIDRMMAGHGYTSWYYQSGTATRWNTGGSDARIGRNYGGLINSIGILFESPGGQTLETGVTSGVVAYRAVLQFVRDRPERVVEAVNRARAETVALGERAEGDVAVRMRYEPEDFPVTYRIAVGQGDERRIVTVESDSLMKKPVATLLRPRPFAYLLPPAAVDAVAMLRRHNIAVEVLRDSTELDVQAYTLTAISYEQAYNHAAATKVETGGTVDVRRTFPPGTFVVRTGQLLGRVVTHMLEPETTDNIVYWNTMDAWLPKAALQRQLAAAPTSSGDDDPPLIPIYKVPRPLPLPTRLLLP